MPMAAVAAPTRLALFALEEGVSLPIARMPIYAEVLVRSAIEEPLIQVDHRFDDPVCIALRKDAPENIIEPQPLERLTLLILEELARQLGPDAPHLGDSAADFVVKALEGARAAVGGTPLRNIDAAILQKALRGHS